ncbi:DDRGK domain-containing protein 1-like [Halichondria panicea]|uniref:DDRGK domain-containing protein 1-like n=1 Tax=Halichondria panicea TaxID=6063 RepID=UPI00312B5458
MDPVIWLVLIAIFVLTLFVVLYFQLSGNKKIEIEKTRPRVVGGESAVITGGVRRRSRNIRSRLAAVQRARGQVEPIPEEDGEEDDGDGGDGIGEGIEEENIPSGKIGTKKLKRIQEKAERKAMREQEEAAREDKKKREALREKERQQEHEEEQESKKQEEEEEARQRVEQERQEHEEYLAMKEAFMVEDEGEGAVDDTEARGVKDFIEHIQRNKIVYLEDLAAEFGLKTQEAIDRIQSLQEGGELTGVIDDRGKFIFISQEELEAVATFIKQRGRVSITDLVTSSNTLINLQSETETLAAV